MLDLTNIAAIEFFEERTKYLRVYYQNDDGSIRESCYDSVNRWFTREGGTVATNARKGSPIAVAHWNRGTQIRLYYLDNNSKICERVGTSSANRITTWTDGADLKRFPVSQGSQLAVARASKDDTTIRVYYQGNDEEIHEVLYRSNRGTWDPTPAKFPKALPGSGLSVVSAKPAGEIRLYYQGRNKELAEHFMASNGRWSPSDLPSYPIFPRASIGAILWGADQSPPNVRIRVYSVTGGGKKVTEVSYNQDDEGWDDRVKDLLCTTYYTAAENSGGVAACRSGDGTNDGTDVFYQSETKVIAELNAISGAVIHKGIPTSLPAA